MRLWIFVWVTGAWLLSSAVAVRLGWRRSSILPAVFAVVGLALLVVATVVALAHEPHSYTSIEGM
jgi:hypothetical protein